MEERDLTVPKWIELPCPGCGEPWLGVDANVCNRLEFAMTTTAKLHICGYTGPVLWVNPDPPAAVWEARRSQASPPQQSLRRSSRI